MRLALNAVTQSDRHFTEIIRLYISLLLLEIFLKLQVCGTDACFPFFAVGDADDDDQSSSQGRHRFPKSLLLTKKSYPKQSGEKIQHESPLSSQSILLASLLKPSDAKEGVFSQHYNTPEGFREGLEIRDLEQSSDNGGEFNERETGGGLTTASQFSRHYNTPDTFRAGIETRDGVRDKETDSADPKEFAGQYNNADDFREEFGSNGVHMAEKQGFIPPDEVFQVLSDDNEVPGDSPGMILRLNDGMILPEDESLPIEFQGQERGKVSSKLNPEMGELEDAYYRTDNGLAKIPRTEVLAEGYPQKFTAESGGKAYTEGGLVYLPKQTKGKNRCKCKCK